MLVFSGALTKLPPPTTKLYAYVSPSHSSSVPILKLRRKLTQRRLGLAIRAIDAAQPYDYETQIRTGFHQSNSLKIAIFGLGNFGQFLSKTLVRQGHTVLAHSRSDQSNAADRLGVSFYADPHDLCEQHPEVVLLCTSIMSTETVVRSIPFQRLRRNTLFVDVLSVKEFPRDLLLKCLPSEFDILCTHPMFGPQSGKHSWVGLPFVYDKVRIGDSEFRTDRCDRFLDIFAKEGCRMVQMSCEEHDRYAAESQFVTHTMGRVLQKYGLVSSPINTNGYETLLSLVDNTAGDSFDLYNGLFMYNKNAIKQLQRLDDAFEALMKELIEHLLEVCRKQRFCGEAETTTSLQFPEDEKLDEPPQKLLPLGFQNGIP